MSTGLGYMVPALMFAKLLELRATTRPLSRSESFELLGCRSIVALGVVLAAVGVYAAFV